MSTASRVAVSLNEQGQLLRYGPADVRRGSGREDQAASGSDVDQRIYLRASKTVPYGRVAEIMAAVTSAGFKRWRWSPSRSNNSRERRWKNGGHIRIFVGSTALHGALLALLLLGVASAPRSADTPEAILIETVSVSGNQIANGEKKTQNLRPSPRRWRRRPRRQTCARP
jgi:hypothetical protein